MLKLIVNKYQTLCYVELSCLHTTVRNTLKKRPKPKTFISQILTLSILTYCKSLTIYRFSLWHTIRLAPFLSIR